MSHQRDNIFAGTQVVSLVEVRGTNNSLVHPRGAVGVVTRTPAVAGEQYLVRFPDGFEASSPHTQLEVLKHFKDRLGEVGRVTRCAPGSADGSQGTASPTFDLESFIIYRCVVGSRAYGLDQDDSDADRHGQAVLASKWGAGPACFEDNATQSCYWELQKFLAMALKANPNILECLYSPMVEKVTPLGAELVAARQGFLSQMIFQTFNSYGLWPSARTRRSKRSSRTSMTCRAEAERRRERRIVSSSRRGGRWQVSMNYESATTAGNMLVKPLNA